MKLRHFLTALCLFAVLAPQLPAQSNPQGGTSATSVDVPLWLRELSNLPPKQRQEYTTYFRMAKESYASARIGECLSYLNSCELIFAKNPNVWSLRASALIAQRHFSEAKPLIEKVLEVQPEDSISLFNHSLISLGEGRYADCLKETGELLGEIQHTESMQLCHSLTYRALLCYLMLDQEDKAKELVKDITPMEDSPLYYYSQAAFALYHGDTAQAVRNLRSADRIFAQEKYLLSYKQNLSFSKLEEKALGKKDDETAKSAPAPAN